MASALIAVAPAAAEPRAWDWLATPLFSHMRRPAELPGIPMAFCQDKAGMIWMGTQSGLVRWDGYRPRVFVNDPKDPDSLPATVVTGLLSDASGGLVVATVSGVVARFDPVEERFVRLPAVASGTGVDIGFAGDGEGGLWLANANGLSHLAAGAAGWRSIELPGRAKISSLMVSRDRTLWIGTDRGLFQRPAGAGEFVPAGRDGNGTAANGAAVTALGEASNGEIWFGTNDGRVGVLRDGALRRAEMPQAGYSVRSIVESRAGVLSVGTRGGGLIFLDQASGKLLQRVRFDAMRPSGLASDDIYTQFVDRSGGHWIGHARGADYGATRSGAFQTLLPSDKDSVALTGANLYAIAPRPDGKVWIGSENGGADLLDPFAGRLASLPRQPGPVGHVLPAGRVLGFAQSREGRTWVATGQGLFETDGKNVWRFGAEADGQVNDVLYEDGGLWLGLEKKGLARLKLSDQKVTFYQRDVGDAQSLSDNAVKETLRDPQRGLWVATAHGLNLFDGRRFRHWTHDPADPNSLPADYVVTLLLDRQQRLWVGMMGGGVAIFDSATSRFRHIGRAEGLPNDNIDKLLEDAGGRIWASTDRGVAMIDPATMTVQAYDAADGVALNSHWIRSGGRMPDGTLLFGGNGGLTVIHPDRVEARAAPAPVVITAVRVGGRNRPGSGPVVLPPGAHGLQVEFAALDYAAPERNRYAYRLVGFDGDWIPSDAAHRLAAYTNLPPGRYTLLMRGSNHDGTWTNPPAELSVTVVPAWYQTIWFVLGLGTLFIAAFAGLLQSRTAYLRRRHRELEALVAERTADLERLSVTDQLTGLFNRRKLDETLLGEKERCERYAQTFSIVMADLDRFKAVNDQYGHQIGDVVLATVAKVLRQGVRKTDVIGRWGGEEFMLICPNTDVHGAVAMANNLRQLLAGHVFEGVGRSTCSFGVAEFISTEPVTTLVSRADAALYRAKRDGRDRVEADPRTDGIIAAFVPDA